MVCVDSILRTSCPRRQRSDVIVLVRFGGQKIRVHWENFSDSEELESGWPSNFIDISLGFDDLTIYNKTIANLTITSHL
jgi:hypothetical protein